MSLDLTNLVNEAESVLNNCTTIVRGYKELAEKLYQYKEYVSRGGKLDSVQRQTVNDLISQREAYVQTFMMYQNELLPPYLVKISSVLQNAEELPVPASIILRLGNVKNHIVTILRASLS